MREDVLLNRRTKKKGPAMTIQSCVAVFIVQELRINSDVYSMKAMLSSDDDIKKCM